MGFLHKLWDETLAGPAPDSGLGKLRKYDSFSSVQTVSPPTLSVDVPITRSITVIRTNSVLRSLSGPDSSSGPTTPGTPSTPGTPVGDFRKFTRRKSSTDTMERAQPRSLTFNDWFSFCYVWCAMA